MPINWPSWSLGGWASHTCCADLLLEAALGAVELQEEGRSHRVGQRAESVARIHHHVIQELYRHNAQKENQKGEATRSSSFIRIPFSELILRIMPTYSITMCFREPKFSH